MERPNKIIASVVIIDTKEHKMMDVYDADEIDAWIEQEIRKREIEARIDEIKTIMWLKEHSEGWLQNRAEVMEQQLKEFN
jgi:hypothetical protein